MANQTTSIGAPLHSRRSVVHYGATAVILGFYGAEVCPFLETLTTAELITPIIIALMVQYVLRAPLDRLWVSSAPLNRITTLSLRLEYGLFIGGGFAVLVYNNVVYDFPMESGLKVVVGMATLGFFAALDLSLERQRAVLDHIKTHGGKVDVNDKFFPLSGKLGVFAATCVLFSVIVVFLLVSKDLAWLAEGRGDVTLRQAQIAILAELAFVVVVLLGHVLNVILAYTGNLHIFFSNENGVLNRVTNGNLNSQVPVGSNDEFGLMAVHTNRMIEGLRRTTEEVKRTRDVTILSLASLAETRDNETGAHILRTQRYVKVLAENLKNHPKFAADLTEENIDLLYKSAPLHDVGKVGIPDSILLKPGKLTKDEFEIMKTHTTLGADALAVAEGELGSNSFLRFAKEIALTHQEKWDGSGYPQGLSGEAIPLSGRLMAVADVYDALISKRVYKPAFSHQKACDIIIEGSGTHFDPDLIEAFRIVALEFAAIADEISDHQAEDAA